MIHDPERSSERPRPPKDEDENDRDTNACEVDGERGGADDGRDTDRDDGRDTDRDDGDADESRPERLTAWLRLVRAVLLVIVATTRLIRSL